MTGAMARSPDPQQPRVIQWLVDTRPLWPSARVTKDLELVVRDRFSPTWPLRLEHPADRQQKAARALALLTPQERAATLRFHFVRDAKLALASHLLKRLIVH